jgi:large subunit ribosomal protein L13
MKTFSAKAEEIERKWWVIDANNRILGDVAVAAATLLRGKNKPLFTPHVDCGDFVVIINAEKVKLSGKKEDLKTYTRFSGYVGGLKRENVAKLRQRRPEQIVERAVHGMIPHNRLGRQIFKKLKIYAGPDHPHEAQGPEPYAP